ncbi:MAG: TBC domain-containing protein [archaeon]|nr:TBC domain-containing protein [archaeon]
MSSTYDKIIKLDLPRTFPNETFFQSKENLDKLHRILIAYSRRNALVGYCQGFNFLAGRILQIMIDEV